MTFPTSRRYRRNTSCSRSAAFLKAVPTAAAPAIDFPPYDKAKARTHDFHRLSEFPAASSPSHPLPAKSRSASALRRSVLVQTKRGTLQKVDPATLARSMRA